MIINPYAFSSGYVAPAGIGGIDANTVLMLHMDGADTSTTFTDDSDTPHTVTASNGQIATAQSVFGGASGYHDGSTSTPLVTIPDSNDWAFGSEMCIDAWVRFTATEEIKLFLQEQDANNYLSIAVSNAGYAFVYQSVGGSLTIQVDFTISAMTLDTWYHVAIAFDGTTWHILVDGVHTDSSADSTTIPNISGTVSIGDIFVGSSPYYIDELRISNSFRLDETGDPLYCGGTVTSGFFPPGTAYTYMPGMWKYYETGRYGAEIWQNMETGGSAQKTWQSLES